MKISVSKFSFLAGLYLLAAKKVELDRLAVRQQIVIDTNRRQLIEEMKEKVKKTAMMELEEWESSNRTKETKGKV